ncbi:hypothetical protein BDZ85DRAFT_135438 [Elsinoe ampelina]|uniref:Uncharacterized protein n=1 Tax=Elsinoe ampelina TaxID=302913 RepID=A0A6A6G871_9PEZI|nr:hypothetical protein BDZ85DRAFT_135438 [Elsinoe ampelina]
MVHLMARDSRNITHPTGCTKLHGTTLQHSRSSLLAILRPGLAVYREGYEHPVAISIHGGYVHMHHGTGSTAHWTIDPTLNFDTLEGINMGDEIIIGSVITENSRCRLRELSWRQEHKGDFVTLGTLDPLWKKTQRQVGVQAGHIVTASVALTQSKMDGITKKDSLDIARSLTHDQTLMEFLEGSWGFQVSMCPGVARRVSLRAMVTDLILLFATRHCTTKLRGINWWISNCSRR